MSAHTPGPMETRFRADLDTFIREERAAIVPGVTRDTLAWYVWKLEERCAELLAAAMNPENCIECGAPHNNGNPPPGGRCPECAA